MHGYIDVIGASRSEPHTGDVNRDFPFVYIYMYIISAVRPSFRIYLSSISMICNISSDTRMRIRRRGTRARERTLRCDMEKEGKLCDIKGH